jgi:hypothetical protein
VETGVANGFSTAFALLALDRNGEGHLHSVDLPREVGRAYESRHLLRGRGACRHPVGLGVRLADPAELKERWTLVLGRTQDELPPLLERLGRSTCSCTTASTPSTACGSSSTRRGRTCGAAACSSPTTCNSTEAFPRFSREQGRKAVRLARGMALLQK